MVESCHWCAGRGDRFGGICLICAGAGFLVPNPRPYQISFTFFADEIVLAREFLAKLEPSMLYAFTQSVADAEKLGGALAEIRIELEGVSPKLEDFDLAFPRYPDPPRG